MPLPASGNVVGGDPLLSLPGSALAMAVRGVWSGDDALCPTDRHHDAHLYTMICIFILKFYGRKWVDINIDLDKKHLLTRESIDVDKGPY
jgi:hypothetical protein